MAMRKLRFVGAGLIAVMACAEGTGSTEPGAAAGAWVGDPAPRAAHERLARLFARALLNPAFRAHVRAQLDASPFPEHKLQLQAFLDGHGGRGIRALAEANGITAGAVRAEAAGAIPLELYLPVPSHRAAWSGGEEVVVATALADHEPPVAFDLAGRRHQLSADQPPATPVLAVVPVETDFSAASLLSTCIDCAASATQTAPPPGLYLTKSHLEDDFEGWLKGSPEIEVHVLGQKGASDTLISYQCAGATRSSPYYFDQNNRDWTGSVMLFSKAQLDAYNAAHPNKNIRVFLIEDDDTACDIRTDRNRLQDLFRAVDGAYKSLTAGNDSSSATTRAYRRAGALYRILVALASWIKSNDDPIGNAVEDVVVGTSYPGYNWHIKGDNNVTNGRILLEMR